jgi:hypothetical protein
VIGRLFERPQDVIPLVGNMALWSAPMVPIGLAAGLILRMVALFQLRRAASQT